MAKIKQERVFVAEEANVRICKTCEPIGCGYDIDDDDNCDRCGSHCDLVRIMRTREIDPVRVRIFNAAFGKCSYCNCELDISTFQVDHVVPKALGGRSTRSNMVASCAKCNLKKRAHPLSEFLNMIQTEMQ